MFLSVTEDFRTRRSSSPSATPPGMSVERRPRRVVGGQAVSYSNGDQESNRCVTEGWAARGGHLAPLCRHR